IYSNIEYSRGYFSFKAELNNVNIKDEIIEVSYRPINLSNLTTNNSNSPISFTNSRMISNLKTDNFIDGSKNIRITNNIINTGFVVKNSQNIVIENNSKQ